MSLTCNASIKMEIVEIIFLPDKLGPLTSDETELPSVSNRMSLVHKHPVDPTARERKKKKTSGGSRVFLSLL